MMSSLRRLPHRQLRSKRYHTFPFVDWSLQVTHGMAYQVRAGAETCEDADRLCAAIQRAGGACLVLSNFPGAG
jgi:hypothetical protein